MVVRPVHRQVCVIHIERTSAIVMTSAAAAAAMCFVNIKLAEAADNRQRMNAHLLFDVRQWTWE